jgi:hypothetical protein
MLGVEDSAQPTNTTTADSAFLAERREIRQHGCAPPAQHRPLFLSSQGSVMELTRIAAAAPALLMLATFSAKTAETAVADGKARTLYRCQVAGVTTFSDRPCGATAQERALAQAYVLHPGSVNISDPPVAAPVQAVKPPNERTKPAADSDPPSRQRHAEACRRIQVSLRDIRSKMRAGYSAKQGERLQTRQRTLDEKYRTERCR